MEYNEQERLEKEAEELMQELKELQFKYAQDKSNDNLKNLIEERRKKVVEIRTALRNSMSPVSKTR